MTDKEWEGWEGRGWLCNARGEWGKQSYCRRLSCGSRGKCSSRVSRLWSLSAMQDNL